MNRAFFIKTLNDAKWLLLACATGIFAFSWIRVSIVASMEAGRFQKIVRNLPDLVKRLSPVPVEDLVNYPGLIGFTFEEPIVYLIMAVWAISRGSDSVSGEIGRGTMEMLLAQPVSRTNYLLSHAVVTLLGVAVLACCAFWGTHVGIQTSDVDMGTKGISWQVPVFGFEIPIHGGPKVAHTQPMQELISSKMFIGSAINYFCLGVFLSGLTMAVSSVDRFRWRTIGLMVGFYIIETVIELTGLAVKSLRWLLNCTFFAAYEPVEIAVETSKDASYPWHFFKAESTGYLPDLAALGMDVALLVLGGIGLLFAFRVINRRDLPAPL